MNSKPMRYLLSIFLVLCTIGAFSRQKKAPSFVKPLPVPHRAVNDFGKFINQSEREWLEKELVNYNIRTGNAIVFISLESLTDPKTKKEYTIEEAANLYFNTWGIGDSIKNNGVLLIVTKTPRRVRIEVGKGLEAVLPNRACQKIIDENLVPNFKQGLFFTGIKEAVERIEYYLDHSQSSSSSVQQSTASYYSLQDTTAAVESEKTSTAGGVVALVFVLGLPALLFWWARKQAKRFGGWFTGGGYRRGYRRRGYYNDSFNNNNNTYNNNNFYSGGGGYQSSGGGGSSSSSGSYSSGRSSGGGASGSW